MTAWKKLFENRILERGRAYYREGAVHDLRADKTGIQAVVEGSESYDVSIELDNGEVMDMECDCPYAESGEKCKHMASVLFAWEHGNIATQDNSTQPSGSTTALVEKANETMVRRFLAEALEGDAALLRKFRRSLDLPLDQADVEMLRESVDDIVDTYMEDGFIDYEDADDFVDEITDILDNDVGDMLMHHLDEEAFELSNHVILALNDVEMDDSDGGIMEIIGRCENIWHVIIERANDALKSRIFSEMEKHLDGSLADYLESGYEDVLMDHFTEPDYAERKLALIDKRIECTLKDRNEWRVRYGVPHWVMRRIRAMEQLNNPESNILAFCRRYWQLAEVRKYVMDLYHDQGEWEKLIPLLKESLNMDKDRYGLVSDYHDLLKESYRQLGMMENYRDELRYILTKTAIADLDAWRELKQQFSPEEWLAEREKLFKAMPGDAYTGLNRLYSEEKLWDRLLDGVLSANGLFEAKEYAAELMPIYPDQMLSKFAMEMRSAAQTASNREQYRELVNTLRYMKDTLNGTATVDEIITEWRLTYRRRRAMIEELEKL